MAGVYTPCMDQDAVQVVGLSDVRIGGLQKLVKVDFRRKLEMVVHFHVLVAKPRLSQLEAL